jgi:hypothetical protein
MGDSELNEIFRPLDCITSMIREMSIEWKELADTYSASISLGVGVAEMRLTLIRMDNSRWMAFVEIADGLLWKGTFETMREAESNMFDVIESIFNSIGKFINHKSEAI